MKISAALSGVGLFYVETAPFIYYTEKRPVYVDKMREVFRALDAGQFSVMTSTISLSESLTKPLREADTALVTAYTKLFERTEGLSMFSVTSTVARRSAHLRARYNLKTPDARP